MEQNKPIGFDEIMIINPSHTGVHTMLHRPINGAYFGYPPGAGLGNPGHYGYHPGGFMGYYGQYPEDELGYYGDYPADDFVQYPEDELGYYGQYPGADTEFLEHRADQEMMGNVQQYPGDFVDGYVPETEPPFNPRWGSELSGYEAEKSVNPMCEFRRPAEVTPPDVIPDIFRPHL